MRLLSAVLSVMLLLTTEVESLRVVLRLSVSVVRLLRVVERRLLRVEDGASREVADPILAGHVEQDRRLQLVPVR